MNRHKLAQQPTNRESSEVGLTAAHRIDLLTMVVADENYPESLLTAEQFEIFREDTCRALEKVSPVQLLRFMTSWRIVRLDRAQEKDPARGTRCVIVVQIPESQTRALAVLNNGRFYHFRQFNFRVAGWGQQVPIETQEDREQTLNNCH